MSGTGQIFIHLILALACGTLAISARLRKVPLAPALFAFASIVNLMIVMLLIGRAS